MIPAGKEENKVPLDILDNCGVMLIYLNAEQDIVFCNKKTERITGSKSEDIAGGDWRKILFRGNGGLIKQEMFKAVLDECVRHKREKDFEGIILDGSGKERIISWNFSPVVSEDGKVKGSLLTGHDVTRIREAANSVKSIDSTLKNIFFSLKDYALYVTNLEGNITYFSTGSEVMLGWKKKDVIFRHVDILHGGSGQMEGFSSILEEIGLSGRYEKEAALSPKTGKLIPVVLTVNKFFDSEKKHSGYIFVAKDITERRHLEYQAFQSEKMAALGLLSAGMAHEINNPLLVILGRCELLAKERLGRKERENLGLISSQAERIQKLVDRILKFSQKSKQVFEPVNINEAIEFIIPFARYSNLPDTRVDLVKDFEEGLPPVRGDLHQLQEVFLNLLINAYQSISKNGKIEITTRRGNGGFATVTVKDTGSGIPPEHLKDIFMPFFSTKTEGKGLGLSICYNIVKDHNGRIGLESRPGEGSVFTIELPFI
ncbi:MAG: PAS domain S-box protein [Candidatus Omnitrophica bacterium]|nr:PAS domain S-box protein [Candidatus Omnitrophota bacterium]MDD5042382.1 PAS domain S-box protein [Candidatus Omnitrophota bacterium]